MIGVAQPRQLRAAKAGIPAKPEVECRGHATDGRKRDAVSTAGFERTDQGATDVGLMRQVGLAPATPVAQGSDGSAQGSIVHWIDAAPSLLTARLLAER